MRKVVHNSKALTKALEAFILARVTGHRTSFEVSDVKADGTVFVKFRSSPVDSATDHARRFRESLEGTNRPYVQTQECIVRLALNLFSSGSV